MKKLSLVLIFSLLMSLVAVPAVSAATPAELFADYLANFDAAPQFIQIGEDDTSEEGVIIRRGYFEYESLNGYTAYAVIAMPADGTALPGLVYYHGSAQTVEANALPAAVRYAKAGYVVIAPELYGITDQATKNENTNGSYDLGDYDGAIYNMSAGAKGSAMYAAIGTGIEAYKILSKLENVDATKIGVSGTSYGGYMATMVSGLLGSRIQATYALYGAGFFDQGTIFGDGMLTYDGSIGVPPSIATTDRAQAAQWRAAWFESFDAGRAAGTITDLFVAASTNDGFFYPTSINATIEAAPNKNLNFSPNDNHSLINTPHGENLDLTYLNSKLKGGDALPKFTYVAIMENADGTKSVNAIVENGALAEGNILDVRVWYSSPNKGWQEREWKSASMNLHDYFYGITLPDEVISGNCDWYVSAYNDVGAATSIVYRNAGVLQNQTSNTSVVKNGEFENNGASWSGGTWQAGGVNGSTGSYTATQNVEQTIPLVSGQQYTFSAYVKVDEALPFQALLLINDGYVPVINYTTPLTPGVWNKVEGQYTSPVTGDVRMFLTTNNPGKAFTVDSFRVKAASRSMYEITETSLAPLAPGYVFETVPEGGYYLGGEYTKATYTHVDGGNGWLRSNATLYGGVDYIVRFVYRGDAAAVENVTGFDLLVLDQNGAVLKQYQVPAPTGEWQVFECKFSRGENQGAGSNSAIDLPTFNIFEFRPTGITAAGTPVVLEMMPLSIQRSNNLIGNGDFEMGVGEGVNPVGFNLVELTASVRAGVGKDGSNGLVMDSRAGGLARVQRLGVQNQLSHYGGVTYQISADFKALEGHGTAFTIMGDGWTNLLTNPNPEQNIPTTDGFTTYTGTFTPQADGTFGTFYMGMWGGNNAAHFVMDNLQMLEPKVSAAIVPVEEKTYVDGRIAVDHTFTQVAKFIEEDSLYRISTSEDGENWTVVASGRSQANYAPIEYIPQAEDVGKFVKIDLIPRDERGALGDPVSYTTTSKVAATPFTFVENVAAYTNYDETQSVTLVVATYEGDSLKNVALKTETVEKGATITLTGPTRAAGETVKVMVLGSLENLNPLLPALGQ